MYAFLAVVFIAVAAVAYPTSIKLIKHNRLLLNNLAKQFNQPSSVTIANYRAILDLSDFDQREVAIKVGQYLGQRGLSGSMTAADLISGYNFFIAAADKAIKANPDDARLLLSYGNAVNVYGELMKKQDAAIASKALQKAEKALLEAAALGKSRQQVFYSLANTYLIAGDNNKGIEVLEAAARIHDSTPTTYWLLAFAYQQAKENDKAILAADKALDRNYVFSAENEANPIASLYLERKDYDRLLRLYKRVADTAVTGTAQARLAALYAQMGRKEEALAAAGAVIARDPSLRAQVEEFIQQVKSGVKKDFLGNN
jgi:tetratricopeptide (TPR) repeat protein